MRGTAFLASPLAGGRAGDRITRGHGMIDESTVGVGSWVTVRDGALEESWRVVDPSEADAARRLISANTPLASALLGHRAGDAVRVQGPERRTVMILLVGP